LTFGETGEVEETEETGGIDSAAVVANIDKLGDALHNKIVLTQRRRWCCVADMIS
jgi:hypothetical protein